MKSIPVTDLRKRVSEVIEDLRADSEPLMILQRSRPAAYLVSPEHFERDQSELKALRRALFVREVREAEAEYAAGEAQPFDDVEDLIRDLRS
jgi:prevent-host-death family protein